MSRKTICLVCICRNEEKNIYRLIENMAGYIDYAIFVDSESTDDTVNVINTMMGGAGAKWKVVNYTKPFRGDEKRTFAIDQAQAFCCDYILVMDADNTMTDRHIPDVLWQDLTADAYYITKRMGDIEYPIQCLFKASLDWEYVGVIHDYPQRKGGVPYTVESLKGCVIIEPVKDGTGKDKLHYYGDALKIENEMYINRDLPDLLVTRYTFYLAQSYRDAGQYGRAIDTYTARIMQGGFDEEIFYSFYMIAYIKQLQGMPYHEVMPAAMRAWCYRPQRKEGAYMLMRLLNEAGFTYAAWSVGHSTKDLPCNDKLFNEYDIVINRFPALFAELDKIFSVPEKQFTYADWAMPKIEE